MSDVVAWIPRATVPVSPHPTLFPMMVNLRGKKCVVVGGGKIAGDKIAGLLACRGRVVVVSPRLAGRIEKQVRALKLTWHRRDFSPRDLEGAFLTVAATDSAEVNKAVFRACSRQGVLCNAVDDPENCDFFYPAVVRRGPLQIAISTSGCSPALASRLRRELEREFGPPWSAWVKHIGQQRREILAAGTSRKERRRRLMEIVNPQAFRAFLRAQGRQTRRVRPRDKAKNDRT